MPDVVVTSQILLWLVVLVLAVVCLALVRQVGILYERVAPAGALSVNKLLKAGEQAPELALVNLDGRRLDIGGRRTDGRSTLLFFLSPLCPVCKTLLPVLKSIERAESGWLDVLYASDGDIREQERFAARHGLAREHFTLSEALGRAFGVGQLPYGVLIDAEGTIAALGLVNSREQIESLFEAQRRGVTSLQDYLRRQGGAPADRPASAGTKLDLTNGAANGAP